MADQIRILIADDHAIVRMGITALLETEPDIAVVGEAEDGEATVRLAADLKPDVILMDLMMPVMDGATATDEIHRAQPEVRILILTTSSASDEITNALDGGACGVLSKNAPYTELVDAIRASARGERYVSADIRHILETDPPVAQLSPRQSEILQLIAKGMSNPDIARLLGTSLYTVKEQVNGLFVKLGACNRAEAVTIALRRHLLKS